MIAALREWTGNLPLVLVVALALLAFLMALAVLVVVSVAVGVALGRLGSPAKRRAGRSDTS
jgi:hypothetical protein